MTSRDAEDWRVEVDLDETGLLAPLTERLDSHELSENAARRLGDGAVLSNDGDKLFVYVATHDAARAAEEVLAEIGRKHDIPVKTEVTHWHDAAEDWEPPSAGDPETPTELQAEHARLIERQKQEVAEQGYPDWEVRVQLPSHVQAHELSERLTAEGVPHMRRWKYVIVGASDEDAAQVWRERLQKEAGAGADVEVEGTMISIERSNPWRTMEELGGGP